MLKSILFNPEVEQRSQILRHLPFMTKTVASLPRAGAVSLILILSLFIGWMDYASGWELSLFILYAAPIVIAVWRLGPVAGLATAILCSLIWLFANGAANPYETRLGFIWAMMSRFFYFLVLVFAVSAVRSKQEGDAAHIKMLEEQRNLEMEIVGVSEHEQQRIGQDLHDGICQQLAAIGCAARVLSDDLQAKDAPEARDAALIEQSIQQAVLEARNLARGIFPIHVNRNGLAAGLQELAETMTRLTGTPVKMIACDTVTLQSREVSKHLYRIAQEAVANAIRHSGATEVTLALRKDGGNLELRVEDNGKGLPQGPLLPGEGMGLRTMRYRAQALGASLEIGSLPAGGTFVGCRLKLQNHEP
jgi:signal transduction histidine kinase